MSAAAPAVVIERRDRVTILRLSRPESRNALTAEIRMALAEAIPAFFADPASGCLLVTGAGENFCAGGDLKSFDPNARPSANRARIQHSQSWARQLLAGEKPIVMAVNGAAVGAGFGLAMLGDVTLAGEGAFFQPAFPLVGLTPDLGLARTLPRAIGIPRARDILLNNRKITAAEAYAMGMIARIVPDNSLFDEALKIADRLAQSAQPALGLTKELLHRGQDCDLDSFFALESQAQACAMGSSDFEEGLAAFLEKRKPRFGA